MGTLLQVKGGLTSLKLDTDLKYQRTIMEFMLANQSNRISSIVIAAVLLILEITKFINDSSHFFLNFSMSRLFVVENNEY